jgi:hypothetical protein
MPETEAMKMHTKIYGWDYVWRDFADEMQAELSIEESQSKSIIKSMHVPVGNKPWTITINPNIHKGKGIHTGTTFTAAYRAKDNFVFAIHTEKWLDHFGKLFGMQDYQIGDDEFDHKFIVQGNDKAKVLDLFSDQALRDLIMLQPSLQLRILSDASIFLSEWKVPKDHNVLIYTQETLIDDFDHLKSVYDLLVAVLNQLDARVDARENNTNALNVHAQRHLPQSSLFKL